jgi:hypothetical protein
MFLQSCLILLPTRESAHFLGLSLNQLCKVGEARLLAFCLALYIVYYFAFPVCLHGVRLALAVASTSSKTVHSSVLLDRSMALSLCATSTDMQISQSSVTFLLSSHS